MKNLSLGLKISLGFALLIIIAGTLGLMSIWNMKKVQKQSNMLADEYVPEVDVAVELRGAANRVMYEMRGYGFTEDLKFYEQAQVELKAVETALEKARELEAKSPNLKKLKGQLEIATSAVERYKGLIQETRKTDNLLDETRKILDTSAAKYMKNSAEFLTGQNEQFKKDLYERQSKINHVSHLVDYGSEARVLNFKAQATGAPELTQKAISKLNEVFVKLESLRELTRDAEDIQRIDATENAAKNYQNALKKFLTMFKKGGNISTDLMNSIRKEMDTNAAIYVKNCDEFLKGQQSKLTKDMLERNEKITLVNDIISLGNATRIGAFKSQALRTPQMMEDALKNFPKIDAKFEDLKKITRLPEDLKRIEDVKNAGHSYKNAMTTFLENWIILQELGTKRGQAGKEVIKACIVTADAGMAATDRIAKSAVKSLSGAATIMIIGLIAALAVGSLAAFFITRSITAPVNRIIAGLNEGATQVASASGQVSSSSQSMAEGASQQAASIEETSSSMEEMASMTKRNAQNAGNADNLMKETNQIVNNANSSMSNLIHSMDDISKASEETFKIIKTIDEIAFQTNLLALNAAVEAARAGEAGAGFAVVADEVRNLAMRAADAAKDTAELIEGTVKKVNDGSELVESTNDAFKKVAESSAQVGTLVSEITEASKEQSSGIDQVNNTVMEMDKVVQQNAANAEESASASEEMNAQAEQLKDYVSELISIVSGNTDNRHIAIAQKSMETTPYQIASQKTESKKILLQDKNEVRPEQVIPFEEESEFKDF